MMATPHQSRSAPASPQGEAYYRHPPHSGQRGVGVGAYDDPYYIK